MMSSVMPSASRPGGFITAKIVERQNRDGRLVAWRGSTGLSHQVPAPQAQATTRMAAAIGKQAAKPTRA